ncbi:MAG: hypothetical protein KC994_01005 [Candidatus Omnitrophica bacterium]|nr:hypothetical protein [Candidatus Omnitrophota bacterium]
MPHTPRVAEILQNRFNHLSAPIVVAVGGPGGTGKSFFSRNLAGLLSDSAVLTLDDYKEARAVRAEKGVYGPHPSANKMDLILDHLVHIKQGKSFDQPVYCSKAGDAATTKRFQPAKFNLLDGEVSTYRDFREWVDFAIYIESDWKTQLMSRVVRDVEERGHTPEKVLTTFLNSNLREFPKYGEPTRSQANLILHCDSDYQVTIRECRDV